MSIHFPFTTGVRLLPPPNQRSVTKKYMSPTADPSTEEPDSTSPNEDDENFDTRDDTNDYATNIVSTPANIPEQIMYQQPTQPLQRSASAPVHRTEKPVMQSLQHQSYHRHAMVMEDKGQQLMGVYSAKSPGFPQDHLQLQPTRPVTPYSGYNPEMYVYQRMHMPDHAYRLALFDNPSSLTFNTSQNSRNEALIHESYETQQQVHGFMAAGNRMKRTPCATLSRPPTSSSEVPLPHVTGEPTPTPAISGSHAWAAAPVAEGSSVPVALTPVSPLQQNIEPATTSTYLVAVPPPPLQLSKPHTSDENVFLAPQHSLLQPTMQEYQLPLDGDYHTVTVETDSDTVATETLLQISPSQLVRLAPSDSTPSGIFPNKLLHFAFHSLGDIIRQTITTLAPLFLRLHISSWVFRFSLFSLLGVQALAINVNETEVAEEVVVGTSEEVVATSPQSHSKNNVASDAQESNAPLPGTFHSVSLFKSVTSSIVPQGV